MPYLDGDWTGVEDGMTKTIAPAGLWIPEKGWEQWKGRGTDLPLREKWETKGIIPRSELDQLALLSDEDRRRYLDVLGKDLGSVQRDGFFYTNFTEQLKQSPDDATAEKIINTMEEIGFTSVKWHHSIGGPPPHESFRGWKRVLNWLIRNMAKAGQIILNIAEFLAGVLSGLGIAAVTVAAAAPLPQVGIDIPTDLFNNRNVWTDIRQFLENAQVTFAEGVSEA
jgi:hypothetical protein